MIKSLIISLLLTLIFEMAVSYLLGIRHKSDVKVIICANVITNPVVVYIANLVLMLHNEALYICVVGALELSAFISEYIIFKKYMNYKKISPLVVSLINNAVSFGMGLIINIFNVLSESFKY